MVICFMNHPLNYDDPMIVSSRFADSDGFATLSVCTYKISSHDPVPEVGEQLCRKEYQWWKMPCTDCCVCKKSDSGIDRKTISNSRIPTGQVLESNLAEDGDI